MSFRQISHVMSAAVLALGLFAGCSENTTAPGAPPSKLPPPLPQGAPPASSLSIDNQITVYESLLKEHPDNLDVLTKFGNLLMDNGRFSDAATYYGKALEITPEDVNIRVDMGTCYRRMGQPQKAVDEYRKGLTYQPDHVNGLTNLGVVLAYDLKDYGGAAEAWEKALEAAPNHQMGEKMRQEIEKFRAMKLKP